MIIKLVWLFLKVNMWWFLCFLIGIIGWALYTKLIYNIFLNDVKYSNYMSYLNYIDQLVPSFNKLDNYTKISYISSGTHAILSLIFSLYFFINYNNIELNVLCSYNWIVGVSLSYYVCDLLMVGYYKPEIIFVGHHLAALVIISTFYIYGHLFPHMYSFGMILAEITNPFQITFHYLVKTKQTNTKRFFVVSTIFTFLFTYIRCIIVPVIYWELSKTNKLNIESHKIWAQLFDIAVAFGEIGGFIWTYYLIKGYYQKVYLPIFSTKKKII